MALGSVFSRGPSDGTFDLRHHAKAAPNLPAFMAFMLIVLQIDWAENMGKQIKDKFLKKRHYLDESTVRTFQ